MQKDKTELEVTRMTKENIQYLDVFFAVRRAGTSFDISRTTLYSINRV